MLRSVQRLHRDMRGLGREEGPERKTVNAEDRNVQKRKAGRCPVGTGDVPGDVTKSTEEMKLRAACVWV